MKRRIWNTLFAACLTATLTVGAMPAAGLRAEAAGIADTVESGLAIRESEIHQLLTGDLALPSAVNGLPGATVTYSVGNADARYVSIDGNTLKVTRPYAGEGDYSFTLSAAVESGGESYTKEFPLTVREGLSDDSYAGYLYVCFSDVRNPATSAHEWTDVQQVHFFLSQDGLNWTALNGCSPAFKAGSDYLDNIESCGANSVNYNVAAGTDISKTVSGDASVLFPFEGRDQGIRDPYMIRGSRADGSDSNKVWILATDLNTHAQQYGTATNKTNNICGNWGLTSTVGVGSTHLFIYETEDFVHWTRRWIDVGSEISSAMAWAPEAIYNPEKDNYLVYWSARVDADGSSRDRLYCNETKDFVTFGPTKLYEQEPFYKKYGESGRGGNSGYGNIDTSQLWVAGKDADGKETPYGTLFRLVKDETNNHIELMSAKTVLDPSVDYDATDPIGIKPYQLGDITYSAKADLSNIPGDTNEIKRADIVYNWFEGQSVGDHFTKIDNAEMEGKIGAYEGATMFKFIDREEWCVMIDAYGDMSVRYEPYLTTDLSQTNSIKKVTSGYGRTGGDVGCHGGMIPITVKEYNTLIDTYNADATVANFHKIDYIPVDTRVLGDKAESLKSASQSSAYSSTVKAQMVQLAGQMETMMDNQAVSSTDVSRLAARADKLVGNKLLAVPELLADSVTLDETSLTLCTKATEGLATKAALRAEASIDRETSKITFHSSKPSVAAVDKKGVVTAKKAGTATITAKAPGGAKATCKVTVKGIPSKITLNKKTAALKVKETLQLKVTIPKGTVCSKFKFKSNKPKVASVSSSGKITAKKKGTAKITVTAGNNSKAKATVTVKVR